MNKASFFHCQPGILCLTQGWASDDSIRCDGCGWRRLKWEDEPFPDLTINLQTAELLPTRYLGYSPHTLSPHSHRCSSIKRSSLLLKDFFFFPFCFSLEGTNYSCVELAAYSRPVSLCAFPASNPAAFAFTLCCWTWWFYSVEQQTEAPQQYDRPSLGRTEQGLWLSSGMPASLIWQLWQTASFCATRTL